MFQTLAVHKAPEPTHATPAFSTEVSTMTLEDVGADMEAKCWNDVEPFRAGQVAIADEHALLALQLAGSGFHAWRMAFAAGKAPNKTDVAIKEPIT